MPYSAASITNAFLSRAFRDQKIISPMKAQKLVYFAHGYVLCETREPLLDELFEAWKFGPVLPSLYHECKKYGKSYIVDYLRDYDRQTSKWRPAPIPSDCEVNDVLDFVWITYGDMEAITLSDWTHVKGGPWDKITQGGSLILRNQAIPNIEIETYFRENMYDDLFEKATQKTAP